MANPHMTEVDAKTLRRELVQRQRELSDETQNRETMLRLLGQEKNFQTVPQEHITELERKEEELSSLHRESAVMKDYLNRGVNETRRLVDETVRLRSAVEVMEAKRKELNDSKARMTETIHKLELDIIACEGATNKQKELKVDTDVTVAKYISLSKEILDEVAKRKLEIETLKQRIADYHVVLGKTERLDNAADGVAASCRRAKHLIDKLRKVVETGAMTRSAVEELSAGSPQGANASPQEAQAKQSIVDHLLHDTDASDFDSADEAEPNRAADRICLSAKLTADKTQEMLLRLHALLSRFEQDERNRIILGKQQHEILLQEAKDDLRQLQLSSAHHLDVLRGDHLHKEPLLRRFLDIRRDASQRNEAKIMANIVEGTVPLDKPFSLFDFLSAENSELEKERASLRTERKRLADKVAKREADFEAVRDLRHMYRDLDAKKTLLSIDLRTAEKENKEMKMGLWIAGATSPNLAPSQLNKSVDPSSSKKVWRHVAQS